MTVVGDLVDPGGCIRDFCIQGCLSENSINRTWEEQSSLMTYACIKYDLSARRPSTFEKGYTFLGEIGNKANKVGANKEAFLRQQL